MTVMTPDDALRQAWMTAHTYMLHAKRDIDEAFGAGYAAKHPELVAAYMQVAARDFDTAAKINGHWDEGRVLTVRLVRDDE